MNVTNQVIGNKRRNMKGHKVKIGNSTTKRRITEVEFNTVNSLNSFDLSNVVVYKSLIEKMITIAINKTVIT